MLVQIKSPPSRMPLPAKCRIFRNFFFIKIMDNFIKNTLIELAINNLNRQLILILGVPLKNIISLKARFAKGLKAKRF